MPALTAGLGAFSKGSGSKQNNRDRKARKTYAYLDELMIRCGKGGIKQTRLPENPVRPIMEESVVWWDARAWGK